MFQFSLPSPPASRAVLGVLGLPEREWHISILDHVLNLSPHYSSCQHGSIIRSCRLTRQGEQDQPVDHQDGPEHRHIEDPKPGAEEADGNGPGGRVPELEFRKAPNERAELVVLLCG